jgi:hypothetical protein
MKFVVDELPYYNEFCPLYLVCGDNANDYKCPRYWDKYKICSGDNPHACKFLVEASNLALMDTRCCRTCKHFGELNMESSCAPCYGYSNWEFKNER